MEKRRSQRARKRITCELVIEGKSHTGIVNDVSAAGLFVQTRARPQPGTPVEVVLRPEGGGEEIRLEGSVARQRVVPTRLQSSLPGGVGLVFDELPEGFEQLLTSLLGGDASGSSEEARATRTYRVRVKQRSSATSRVITVRSESAQSARARALRQAGSGWTVADVQEL